MVAPTLAHATRPPVGGAMSGAPNLLTIERYLRLLYGDDPRGYLAICTFNPAPVVRWFEAGERKRLVPRIEALSQTQSVYHSIGLHAEKLDGNQRGGVNHVSGIPGLYLDVDWADPVHKSTNLPPNPDAALALIAEFPLPPTLIVRSGHGYQAHWLFPEPWMFDNDAERAEAQDLSDRFQRTMIAKAAAHGWSMDTTGDLARVFRVAGGLNWKDPADVRPVTIEQVDEQRRYNASDFEPYLLAPEALTPRDLVVLPSLNLEDDEILRRVLWREKYHRLYEDGDLSYHGGDHNRADLALCDAFVKAGASAEQTLRLWQHSALWRPKGDEKHRSDGATYAEMTIEKALLQPDPAKEPQLVVSARPPTPTEDEPSEAWRAQIAWLEEQLAAAHEHIAHLERTVADDAALQRLIFQMLGHPSFSKTDIAVYLHMLVIVDNERTRHDARLGLADALRDQGKAKVAETVEDRPHVDEKGRATVWRAELAERAGISVSTVSASVKRLHQSGLIHKDTVSVAEKIDKTTGVIRDRHQEIRVALPAPTLRECLERAVEYRAEAPRNHGGVRTPQPTCDLHPEAGVIVRTETRCAAPDCGALLDGPHERFMAAEPIIASCDDRSSPENPPVDTSYTGASCDNRAASPPSDARCSDRSETIAIDWVRPERHFPDGPGSEPVEQPNDLRAAWERVYGPGALARGRDA
jgi:DNA-binding Lrp family transcriptional regulator